MLPLRPTHEAVFIDIIDRDITRKDLGNGKVLHLLADDGFGDRINTIDQKHPGIRPRWARVLGLGPDVHEDDVKIGDLVLCDTLKWGRRFPLGRDGRDVVYLWRISVNDILGVKAGSSTDDFIKEWEDKLSRINLTIGHL